MILENQPNEKTLSKTFSPTDSSNVALRKSAEWVVERVRGRTLGNFGTITFSDVTASVSGGYSMDLSAAEPLSIANSDDDIANIIATGSILDEEEVTVK